MGALLKTEAESVARVQKQNHQKKKRGCTRGFPVAACQRYLRFGFGARFLCRLSLSLSLFLSVSRPWVLFPSEAACARAHPCLSRDVYRSVGDNHRPRTRSLSPEPITQVQRPVRGDHCDLFSYLDLSSSLGHGFPFPQIPGPRLPDVCTAQASRGRWYRRLIRPMAEKIFNPRITSEPLSNEPFFLITLCNRFRLE